jgi:molybdate transport system regulatory protein
MNSLLLCAPAELPNSLISNPAKRKNALTSINAASHRVFVLNGNDFLADRSQSVNPAPEEHGSTAMQDSPQPAIHIRIRLDRDTAIGPGKADLLEGIRETGSIAAAGRRMKMSYKRAWMLVETMNAAFEDPVVETTRGGSARGGAVLTENGEKVLACYRHIVSDAMTAAAGDIETLQKLLKRSSD